MYLDAGYFGQKAINEAQLFGKVNIIASSKERGYADIPHDYIIPGGAAYFHCTSNNTIEGTQMFRFPETNVPIICDMSSDIFSREIDVNKFDLIYSGAQKNTGPAGMTLVIAKNSFLETVRHPVPTRTVFTLTSVITTSVRNVRSFTEKTLSKTLSCCSLVGLNGSMKKRTYYQCWCRLYLLPENVPCGSL